jgi:putative copper resistance protein D
LSGAVALLGLCRLLLDGAALFLWGMTLMLLALVPQPLRDALWQRLALCRRLLCTLILLAVAGTLPLQAANLGEGWPDALRMQMLAALANGTSIGTAWWCQLSALVLLLATGLFRVTLAQRASLLASAILLAGLSLTGHAAMHQGWPGLLHQANDVLHVWAVGAWVGAVPVVLLVLPRLQIGAQAPETAQAVTILRRFSTAGHGVVALVWFTGLVNTCFILGGLPLDWSFAYQRLLALKCVLVGAMVLVALFNRYGLVPALRRQPRALALLARLTWLEILLSLLVMALLAWLGMLQPD